MSHFIALRQRIKAIETIKKTTGAMRLISMSVHSRLRHQKNILEEYAAEIKRTLQALQQKALDDDQQPDANEAGNKITSPKSHIFIVIGSQKGLCGTFNETVFKLFEQQDIPPHSLIITIGKRVSEYMRSNGREIHQAYDQFGASNFTAIANKLMYILFELNQSQTTVLSNVSQTFFSQKAHVTNIQLAVRKPEEQPQFINYMQRLQTKAILLQALYESLLAEQAARFLSMDSATRNAEKVLEQTKLAYNKTRQAYVTRELSELAGSMLLQE